MATEKELQQAKDQLFGFGIGYTCEIEDLLSGLHLTKKEWEQIKKDGGVSTLLEKHINSIELFIKMKGI